MRIITVATHSDGYMPVLNESCAKFGLHMDVLGAGQKWQGFVWRQRLIKQFLRDLVYNKLQRDELIVFVDAYDVLCLQNEKTITERFAKFEKDIVLSSEFQSPLLLDYVYKRIYGTPCGGHKINGGMYMGKSAALLEWLELLDQIPELKGENDDQRRMLSWYKTTCCPLVAATSERKSQQLPHQQKHVKSDTEVNSTEQLQSLKIARNMAVDSQGWLFLNVFQGKNIPGNNNDLFYIQNPRIHTEINQINKINENNKRENDTERHQETFQQTGIKTGMETGTETKTEPKLIVYRSGMEPCFIHGPGNADLDFIVDLYKFPHSNIKSQTRSGWYYTWSVMKNQSGCFVTEIVLLGIFVAVLAITLVHLFRKTHKNRRIKINSNKTKTK